MLTLFFIIILFVVLNNVHGFLPRYNKLHTLNRVELKKIIPYQQHFQPYSTSKTSTELFMLGRIWRVITSNINYYLKKFEDPEKLIEQTVNEMEKDLLRIRQTYAEILATQKRTERQIDEMTKSIEEWYYKAQLALQRNEELLAKEALTRRQHIQTQVESLKNQLETQRLAGQKLHQSTLQLEQKILEAKRSKETLIARAKTAKTSIEINNMLNNLSGTTSMEAFNKMKEKVETLEIQAEVNNELVETSMDNTIEGKFQRLEGSSIVDQEFELLKRRMDGTSSSSLPSTETKIFYPDEIIVKKSKKDE